MPHSENTTSFIEIFERVTSKVKRRKDFVIGPDSINYGDFADRVKRCIGYFHHLGLTTDDRIVVSCEHDIETAVLYMAALCAGVTIVVIDPHASTAEAILLLHAADPHSVFIDDAKADDLLAASAEKDVAVIRIQKPGKRKSPFGLLRLNKAAAQDDQSYPAVATAEMTSVEPLGEFSNNKTALILFTSGTTSRPKGVELSYSNLLVQLQVFIEQFALDESSVILNHLPLHHTDGLNQGVLLAFFAEATWLKPEAISMNNLEELLYSVQRYQITHLISVPSVLAMIMCLPDDVDDCLSAGHFKFVESTAGYLEEKLWQAFEERFACQIVNCYGLTETVSEAIYCGPDAGFRRMGTIGKPNGCDTRIVDEENNEVSIGTKGELTLRGDIVMNGYFRNQEATDEVMKNGWFYTGDMATIDADGFISIVGRKKNVIIRGGINVYPEDVTDTIAKLDGILDAVTIGLPDPLLGERVVSCVLLDGSVPVSEQAIIDYCRQHLSPEKIPNDVLLMDQLPRGPAGKVELKKVRALAENALKVSLTEATGSLPEQVLQLAAKVFKVSVDELGPDSHSESTKGWDSLAQLEFILALEQNFNVKLQARDVMNIQSLSDAIDLIEKRRDVAG